MKPLLGFMRNAMRYTSFLCIGLLLILVTRNAQTYNEEHSAYFRQSVFMVDVATQFGSAFPVAPSLFITNAHVVEYVDDGEPAYYDTVTLKMASLALEFEAAVIKIDPSSDLALLRCDCRGYQPMVLPIGNWPKQGTRIYAAGYGLGQHLSYQEGHAQTQTNFRHGAYHASLPTISGDSGSPVVFDGRVVGVRTQIGQLPFLKTRSGDYPIPITFHAIIVGPDVIRSFLKMRTVHHP